MYRWIIFPGIRNFYLCEIIASIGWCIYKCLGTEVDLHVMAILLGFTVCSAILHRICDNDISDKSIAFTFVVALLDMCAHLCLDLKILRSTKVDLTWFHVIKVGIQIYKTIKFIKETLKVRDLYQNQRLRPSLFIQLVFILTVFTCILTMLICGRGAVIKFSE